ncbi:MAG: AAA family ATPase [Acidimicrobiia bacterium]|nr:AAA family ATPase [Acidimicrobiia bacterium]
MTRILLASPSQNFEQRLLAAFEGRAVDIGVVWSAALGEGDTDRSMVDLTSANPDVVIIGPEVSESLALDLAARFDVEHPWLSVLIVAPLTTDVLEEAIQAGARGVLDPHADINEIFVKVDRALQAGQRRRSTEESNAHRPRNRVVPVLAAKGGAGKTTVATNLAVALAERFPGEVALVDLDLQFGDVASALGVDPTSTIADTMAYGDGLDATTLKAFLTPKMSANLYMLAAPDSPAVADDLAAKHVRRILELLAEDFTYVIIDTAAGLDEIALESLDVATDLVILSSLDVPSIRGTAKEIEALSMLNMDHLHWHVVLNRANSRVGLSVDDVEMTLGHPISVKIPSSRAVPMAMNHGVPVVQDEPKSQAAKAFGEMADAIAGVEQHRTGWLRRRSA